MPVWQALYLELKQHGFVVITVALDKSIEDASPWIEAASSTHPSLIDTQHLVADLYGMVNVPTVVWIDENGRIVRPNDVAFGSDQFKKFTGLTAAPHLNALKAWVRGEMVVSSSKIRALQKLPTPEMQTARAEFGLGKWLYEQGQQEAASDHFARAGRLAPHDFTIRRGSMPMQGIDSFGPDFAKMASEWAQAGHRYYEPLPWTD